MIYLSAEQVLFLHDRLIEETGGEHGVRDLGGLESALARPQAAFGDTEFYPDVFTKAAVLMDGLTRNHASSMATSELASPPPFYFFR